VGHKARLSEEADMDAYERELLEKVQRLESIDALLAQHDKATRLGLLWLTALAALVLGGLGYAISRL
jgi:hypothetical protein